MSICLHRSRQGLESDLKAKEAGVSQVIQEGRGLMDQLERGMDDKIFLFLTDQLNSGCFRIILMLHIKQMTSSISGMLLYIHVCLLLLSPAEIFHP